MNTLLTIQIVSWNSAAELRRTFSALSRSGFQEFDLHVYDNGSSDDSVRVASVYLDTLVRSGRRGELIAGRENSGFCTANNRLLEKACTPWILLLNADCRPEPDALELLMQETGRFPEIAMFAPKILEADESGIKSNGRINAFGLGMFPDGLNRGAGCGRSDSGYLDTLPDTLCPSGAAGLYRRDALVDVGGLTESYFAYGDDYDLGLKLRRAGHVCRRVPASRFIHAASHSLGFGNPKRFYFIERNRIYNLIRHYPKNYLAAAPLLTANRYARMSLAVLTASGRVGQAVRDGNPALVAKALGQAQLDAWKRRHELRQERAELERKWPLDEGRFTSWLHAFGLEPSDAAR